MPPKKKKDVTKKDEEGEVQSKPVAQEPKKEVKEAPSEQKLAEVKKQVKKPQEPKPTESKLARSESDSHKKINLGETEKLTEAELLERRKLRFNLVGTQLNAEQAEKVSKQRMEKFGSSLPESKQDLQKRREKFASGGGSLNSNQDPAILEKRKQKFSSAVGNIAEQQEDPSLVEERKKKFGSNDISLDDEIVKQKERRNQNKGHHRRDNFKRSKPHYQSRDHYDNRDKRFKR